MNQHRANIVRVLAIDDEPYVLNLFEEFLSGETSNFIFELNLCSRADEAVEAVRLSIENDKPFAVAFIDIHLAPGLDGVWAAEQIRTLDQNVEIVMVTAHGDVSPEDIVTRVPPVAKLLYIRKPFTAEEIKQFAVALSAKWQQEIQLHKIRTKLESRVEERTADLRKANEQLSREIEDRKRASVNLSESEEKYRTILDSIEEGYFEIDLAGNFTFFNDALVRIAGYGRNELIGINNREYTSPETAKEMYQIFNKIYRTGEPAKVLDYEIIRKDGTIRVLEMSASLMRGQTGEPIGFRGLARDITERKRAEDALRQSEERFRSIFEKTAVGILIVDNMTRRYTRVNPAFQNISGYSASELLSKSPIDITHPEDWAFEKKLLEELSAGRRDQYQIEKRYVRRDGEIFWGRVTVSMVRDITSHPEYTVSVIEDITEHRRAKMALQESEASLKSILRAAPTGIGLVQARVLFWVSDQMLRMLGYSEAELKGKSARVLYENDEEYERVGKVKYQQIEEKGLGEVETRWKCKDGKTIDVYLRSTPADPTNISEGVIFTALDITERKLAEDALRESEEKFRTVLEANPDPVIVYDMEGKVIYFNPAFTQVFGWSLEERLGKKMDVFVPEENWPETSMMISRVLAGESFSGIETRRYTKDGSIIPVSISGSIYRDEAGNPLGSVINLRDISGQKKLEAQLQQAQKMEAVGTLAGGIAHDFNNLLQAIQGYTELLLMRKKKGERGWRELQEVIRAAQRGGELTQQLLTFSRKVESKRQPLDLNQEVEELRELLERTIPKMIEVKFELSENLPPINADSVQLKQILMNLAVNAKDAMLDGGTLFIETANINLGQEFCRKYAEVKPGDYVQLTISDTGHGMNRETLEHIFDPFYTTKEIGKGTGLGLAIVYAIVKNHEGYTMCHSQPQKGTTFKIFLPVLKQEGGLADTAGAKESGVSIKGGNETVLLVDDEKFIRQLGLDVLGQAGYQVLTAVDGESGLEIYRQEQGRIDLVILDLIMPGMGGSKCLEELLKIDPQAKILIASGYSPDGPTKGILETGAKGFVSKPYDTGQLLDLVRKILDKD